MAAVQYGNLRRYGYGTAYGFARHGCDNNGTAPALCKCAYGDKCTTARQINNARQFTACFMLRQYGLQSPGACTATAYGVRRAMLANAMVLRRTNLRPAQYALRCGAACAIRRITARVRRPYGGLRLRTACSRARMLQFTMRTRTIRQYGNRTACNTAVQCTITAAIRAQPALRQYKYNTAIRQSMRTHANGVARLRACKRQSRTRNARARPACAICKSQFVLNSITAQQ